MSTPTMAHKTSLQPERITPPMLDANKSLQAKLSDVLNDHRLRMALHNSAVATRADGPAGRVAWNAEVVKEISRCKASLDDLRDEVLAVPMPTPPIRSV